MGYLTLRFQICSLTGLHICMFMLSYVSVSACPVAAECRCVERILFCVGANFTDIPYDIPEDTRHLDFHSGDLETVEAHKLSYLSELQELTMDKNKITEVENGTFDSLVELKKISMNENKIKFLVPGLFSYLKNLKFLFLSGNALLTVEGLFDGLTELESLNLDDNQIHYLSSNSFKGLDKLYDLQINNNSIAHVDPNTFQNLPSLVVMGAGSNPLSNLDNMFDHNNHLHYINLTNCHFTTFPAKLSSSLKYLKLGKNYISKIFKNETARYSGLVTLIIEQNNLQFIEDDSFIMMPNLTDIFLFVNNLTRIPGQFPRSVHKIFLDSNAISSIPFSTFQQNTELKILSIGANNVATFDSGSFSHVKSVRELKLDGNPLHILHDNIFLEVPGLQHLALNRLNIHEIYPNCFLGLDALQTLEMARVAIQSDQSIIGNFLIHVPTLEHLNLNESPLVAQYFLSHVTVMASVANLTTLELKDNGLTTIPSTIPWHLPYINKLYLAGNPFHCSEDNIWLHEWFLMEPKIFQDMDKVFCHSPIELKGMLLRDVNLLDFKPNNKKVSGADMYDTTDFMSTEVYHYEDSSLSTVYDDYYTFNEEYYDKDYDNHNFLSFSTVTLTKIEEDITTNKQSEVTMSPDNISIKPLDQNSSNESTDFQPIAIAIGMAFAVIVIMLLIAVIIYCTFLRRSRNVVHHNARQNNGANDYVFIVSKTDTPTETITKPPRKLTREERGSTTSHASQDITNDKTLKVYTLDVDN